MKRPRLLDIEILGHVTEVWSYPVRSIGGELVADLNVSPTGVAADRQYVLIDPQNGMPAVPEKDKRWRQALQLQARGRASLAPLIVFPDGSTQPVDDPASEEALSDFFGFRAAVVGCSQPGIAGALLSSDRFHHFPLHLVTTSSLNRLAELRNVGTVDSRRFRPNVVVSTKQTGFVENQWIGKKLRLGSIDIAAQETTKRCGMTLLAQPGLDEDADILRNIMRHNQRSFGIYCSIDAAGAIRIGDELRLV